MVRVITSDIQISSFLYVQLKKKSFKRIKIIFCVLAVTCYINLVVIRASWSVSSGLGQHDCEFKVCLSYEVSSRPARVAWRETVLQNKKKIKRWPRI